MNLLNNIKKRNYTIEKANNKTLRVQYFADKFELGKKYKVIGSYLHFIYPGINRTDKKYLIEQSNNCLPKSYIAFLEEYNGFSLFAESFNIYGLGLVNINGTYLNTRDQNNPMPFDVITENGGYINPDFIKIGSICEQSLIMKNNSNEVMRVNEKFKEVERWNNIEDCIDDLYSRLDSHYDDEGRNLNPHMMENYIFNSVKNI